MKCFVIYKESEINFNYIFYNIGVINPNIARIANAVQVTI